MDNNTARALAYYLRIIQHHLVHLSPDYESKAEIIDATNKLSRALRLPTRSDS